MYYSIIHPLFTHKSAKAQYLPSQENIQQNTLVYTLKLKNEKPKKPSGAETGIYLEKYVNTMAVDALVLCVTRPSTAMYLLCKTMITHGHHFSLAIPDLGNGWCYRINGLLQDCSNSFALAMELLQFCTKPSIWACLKFPSKGTHTYKYEWA